MINLKSQLSPILSRREIEVVIKRLKNKHITQTESNYLSRSIRPKLKAAEFASSSKLLSLLDYRRNKYEREDSVLKRSILLALKDIIQNVQAVVIFGSYIMNNHTDYQDIDIMVVLKRKIWGSVIEKHKIEEKISHSLIFKADIILNNYEDLKEVFPFSPLLQTQLEYSKVIYSKLNLPNKIIINKPYLYSKLLDTEFILECGKDLEGKYIYNGIRTCLSIQMFINRKISNELIIKTIENNIGKETADNLRRNKANDLQRNISLRYLKYLYNCIEKELRWVKKRV